MLLSHLALCVAEYNRLCDGQGIVEITERVKLPLLTFHCHKELLDSLQGQFVTVEETMLCLWLQYLEMSNT